MKPSNYNLFFYDETEKSYVAYNSFTNALATMNSNDYLQLKKYIDDNSYPLSEEYIIKLSKGGFLIDDSFDEIAVLRHRINMNRYGVTGLTLTIAPTSACNFRCIYCYEKGVENNTTMTPETQDAIIEFVEKKTRYVKKIHIVWYGGEPLLAMDVIRNLSSRFISISKKYGIDYSASIVTNGYLLTGKIAQELIDLKVDRCQITIDGCEREHNEKRPHISGAGTYQQIINNILVLGTFPNLNVSIRINIDKNNLSAPHTLNALISSKNIHNVFIYCSPVRNNNDCHPSKECMSKEDFFNYEFQNIVKENKEREILRKYPKLKSNVCCADSIGAYVIAADGELYKCWTDIGRRDLSIGNIRDDNRNIMNEILYTKYDPTCDDECAMCKFLPICMGGCPFDVRTEKDDRCLYYESNLKQYILEIAKKLRKQA